MLENIGKNFDVLERYRAIEGDNMTVKTTVETIEGEKIMDDLSDKKIESSDVDQTKLADLRAKSLAKQKEIRATEQAKKSPRALNIGFIGTGQGGGRMVSGWYNKGYSAIAINTASMDLKDIALPDSAKCLLKQSFEGASRELSIGAAAAESNQQAIIDCVESNLKDVQAICVVSSLGGGSGAGSIECILRILGQFNKPIIVQAILPMDSEDQLTKQNALETLQKLANQVREKKISNLILCDNAKIESIAEFSSVSQLEFYNVANAAAIEPLAQFNYYSSLPSSMKALDPMEFIKIMIAGEGLTTYGHIDIKNFQEDIALAEAVVNNLENNLLAGGVPLNTAQYVGMMFVAPKKIWDAIPASSVNYAMAMLNDICQPKATFKGLYTTEENWDCVKVYSIFSGCGLPESRIAGLKDEVKKLQMTVKGKEEARNLTLTIDTGNETISAAAKIKEKIAAKNSTFGKLTSNNVVVDRRK
jgi:tubulin-like protein CetZ